MERFIVELKVFVEVKADQKEEARLKAQKTIKDGVVVSAKVYKNEV